MKIKLGIASIYILIAALTLFMFLAIKITAEYKEYSLQPSDICIACMFK